MQAGMDVWTTHVVNPKRWCWCWVKRRHYDIAPLPKNVNKRMLFQKLKAAHCISITSRWLAFPAGTSAPLLRGCEPKNSKVSGYFFLFLKSPSRKWLSKCICCQINFSSFVSHCGLKKNNQKTKKNSYCNFVDACFEIQVPKKGCLWMPQGRFLWPRQHRMAGIWLGKSSGINICCRIKCNQTGRLWSWEKAEAISKKSARIHGKWMHLL